jgi:hypothetical protein
MTPLEFALAVMTYCSMVGGSVSSWGRTWWYNLLVGGVEHSGHRFWLGADVRTWVHLTLEEQARVRALVKADEFGVYTPTLDERGEIARRLGLRLVPEHDHDHLQPIPWERG